ncbi:hypothetical protein H0H93_007875 [Arthromyces matolae]|nr:hypothetical protein H0H93_007875 [Arthromyces matolae]
MSKVNWKQQAKEAIANEVMIGQRENEILLAALVEDSQWTNTVYIKEIEEPQSWRLVRIDEDGAPTDEEVVVTVYGMIRNMDLFPIKATTKLNNVKRMKYMKQSVQLEGLGEDQFEHAIRAAAGVCAHFATEYAEGRLERWENAYAGQDDKVFDLANRMFTPVKDMSKDEIHRPLPKELDPYGLTEKIVQKGFAITDDNMVQYARGVKLYGREDSEGTTVKRPEKFRKGDIVSVQLTFKVVNVGASKLRMITVLRSMTLLNQDYNKVFEAATRTKSVGAPGGLKRTLRDLDAEDGKMVTEE